MRTLPVQTTASTCSMSSAPVLPGPSTMRVTAAIAGTWLKICCSGRVYRGVTSLGFKITAAPARSAGSVSIIDRISGKFHGAITPTSG